MTSRDAGVAYSDHSGEERQDAAAASADDLRILEAMLFASEELMTATRLKVILPNNPDARKIRAMVEKINVQLQNERHPFEIVEIGGGYQFRTITYYHPWVRQIFKEKAVKKLSIQALECLAIIAYKQPLSKAEIEAIRGVVSDGAMKTLLEKRLITIAGRSDKPGRPLLYATTQSFLKYFGLNKIEDLPRIEEFESIAREKMEEMSLDELNEPDLEAGVEGGLAEESSEPSVEDEASSGQSDGTEVTESSIFEVSIDETEIEDEAGEAAAEKPEERVAEKGGEENARGDMVTDKTQAMIRERVVPAAQEEGHWVKGTKDPQEIDMGKTKAFSDSVFDLDLKKKMKSEEDLRVAEAETITMKAIESDEGQSGEAESEEETFEEGAGKDEGTSEVRTAEEPPEVDDSETGDDEVDFEVTDTVSASAAEEAFGTNEKGNDTAEIEVDEVFDIEELTSAIEEVKPDNEHPPEKKSGEEAATGGSDSETPQVPEESSFIIEVSLDGSVAKSSDESAPEDDETSFEVSAAPAGEKDDDCNSKGLSSSDDEDDKASASSGLKRKHKPVKRKKGGKKKE